MDQRRSLYRVVILLLRTIGRCFVHFLAPLHDHIECMYQREQFEDKRCPMSPSLIEHGLIMMECNKARLAIYIVLVHFSLPL